MQHGKWWKYWQGHKWDRRGNKQTKKFVIGHHIPWYEGSDLLVSAHISGPKHRLRSVNADIQHGKPCLATSACTKWPHHSAIPKADTWSLTVKYANHNSTVHRQHRDWPLAFLKCDNRKKTVHWATWKKNQFYFVCNYYIFLVWQSASGIQNNPSHLKSFPKCSG